VFVTLEQDAQRRILTRTITGFRRAGRGHRKTEEVHRQRLYRRPEIEKQLRSAGFEVRTLEGYGRSRFPRGQIGFLARKPATARPASFPPSTPRTSRGRPRRALPR
jgi:hypothetical protein